MSSNGKLSYNTSRARIQRVKLLTVIIFIAFQLIMSTINPVSGNIDYDINNVDSDSDVDSTNNIGNSGSTSYLDAQALDGNDQTIVEENTGTGETSNWNYYKDITVDNTKVTGDLTNFPVFISLTDSDLKSRAQIDGDDIAFFDESGNQLDHEIESYNPNYSGTHAQLFAWVKSNLSSSVDTTITMKYGNSTMSSQENPEAVWDSNYQGIWHLNNDPSSGSPQIMDSTSNNNDGTSMGTMNSGDLISSKIGYGIDFDGSDDGIDLGNDASIQLTGAMTVETWFNVRFVGPDYLVTKSGSGGNRGWDLSFDELTPPNGESMFRYSVAGSLEPAVGVIATNVNTWYHIVGVYNPSTFTRFYLNGVLLDENTTNIPSAMYDSSVNMLLGQRTGSSAALNGTLDEVRLSNTARSNEFITTEYNNLNDPSLFYSISPQYELVEFEGWSYYKVITIDSSKVAGDLSDFPVLVSLYDEDLKMYAQTDGDDIAFFSNNGNQLAHELEKYDSSFNSTHAQLIAWVKTDLSSSIDTTITMKYGDSTISAQENPTLVWNSNYLGVWHLKEDPSVTAPQFLDSTLSNNGTSVGSMTNTDQIDGQIDGSIDFDGTDDYIDMGSSINIVSSSFTITTWAKRGSTTSADIIFQQGSSGPNTGFHAGFRDTDEFTCAFWGDDLDTAATYTDLDWHQWTCTYDASTNARIIYRDGVNVASDTASNDFTGSGTFYLGLDGMVNEGFDGQLDESRLSNIVLSSQWLQTEFNNQNNSDSFYSISSQYQFTGFGWSNYKDITIDNTKVAGDLTNFPMLISLYDEDLKAYAQSDGDDIAFFGTGGNQLAHELESYNANYNGTHAKLTAWVKTDLSGSSDTTITMKYGNMDLMSQENPTLVWSSDYNGVWHLNEDPTGSTPQMLDSTLYANDGMAVNSPTQTTGKIDYGLGFDDSNERSVSVSDSSSLQLSSAIVVSAWIKTVDTSSDVGLVVNKWGSATADRNYWLGKIDGSTFAFYVDDSQNVQIALNNVNDGGWHHVVGVAEGSTIRLYVDGSEINSASYSGSSRTGTSSLAIGRASGEITQEWDGDIDEVKVSNSLKSSNWILTEFNNQNDPDTFYSISSQYDLSSVTIEESVSVGVTFTDTLTSPSITGVVGDLYLTVVSVKNYIDTVSVTGLGLTWTEIVDQPGGRSQTGTSVWWTQGDASTGTVTATIAAVRDSTTMQVHRFSGVDTNPIGNYSSSNTNGVSGSGSGGVDDSLPTLDITTTTSGSMVFGAVAIRSRTFTSGSGYKLVSTSTAGSGGSMAGLSTQQKGLAIAGIVTVNGTLNPTSDWALVGIEIKPEEMELATNYQLEWEHQAQSVDTSKEIYELSIYGFSSDAAESFEIQMWNTSSSSWASPISAKIGTTEQWYNMTISGTGILGSTITWRYRGDNEVNDLVQSTLNIDYAGIASYHENPIFVSTANDLQYNEGSTSNTLTWNSTDSNPDSYTIYQNGSQVDTGTWTNAADIQINVDGLSKGVYNYTIVVTDSYSNQMTDPSWVTVVDATDPVYVATPNDLQYNEGSSSNTLTWNSTDFHADSYTIYQNGSQVDIGTWTNATEITINIDGLSKGVYNYTIVVTDTTDNQAVDTVIVTVLDGTDPVFVTIPNDMQYNEGSTSNTLTWNSTDLYANTYTVYQNGSQVDSGTWTNATEITINVDDLSKGVYNFTIVVTDASGNQITDTTIVSVIDATDPVFVSTPNDMQYNEGSTSNTLTWNSTDLHADSYTIYQNGSQVDTGTWMNATEITINVDGLSKGAYNFTIVVTDTSSNQIADTVIVSVVDGTDPVFVTTPNDMQYNEGSTSNTLTWNSTDLYANTYTVYQNGSQVDSGTWTNATEITLNVDGLSKGVYNFTIVVADTTDNQAVDMVIVTVLDVINPVFVTTPIDLQYNEGSTSNTLTWNSTDLHADSYTVYQNGSQVDTGTWTNATEIITNVDGFSKGVYNFTIVVSDTSGNIISDTVIIVVVDQTAPTLSSPSDVQYIEGTTNNKITWNANDNYPDGMTIYRDGTSILSFGWTPGDIEINVDGLDAGVYNYTIVVGDMSNNLSSDTVYVTVIDNAKPSLTSPTDVLYYEGSTSNTIDWTPTDLHSAIYIIYQNGSQVDTSGWSSGLPISYNIDGLVKGAYNFTIVVFDASSNAANDTVIVTVIDAINPLIDNPTNVLYAFGTTGNTINWTATDNYHDSYIIYQNGSQVDTGSWSSGVKISYNIDGHVQGNYNYTIVVVDRSGNSIVDTVIVTVVDGTALSISSPSDIQYSEGSTGNTIDWIGVDDFPDNYVIYQNGSQVDTGTWSSGSTISYNIDGLSKGSYNLTIVIFDTSSNSVSDEVIIMVLDTTSPEFYTSPSDLEYAEGQKSNQLVWNSTDLYPATYIIYREGSQVDSSSWSNASQITINVDGLLKGVYNYTIVVIDLSGNEGIDIVFVTVTDETDPVFTNTPIEVTYVEGSVGNVVNWTATDSYAGNYIILQNGSQVDSNTWLSGTEINYNIDGLLKGDHNFTIIISDSSANSMVDTVIVTIVDLTPPSLLSPSDIQYEEGITGNKIIWNVNDNYPDIMTVYRDGTVIFSSSWTSGNIEIFIDFLSIGQYNFTIGVLDKSLNFAFDTVIVTVVDTQNPTINSPLNVSYPEGTTGNTIDWTGIDTHAGTYVIYQNGSQVDSSTWTSGVAIIYNIDGLLKETYNYTIVISDTSNNPITDTVFVIVNDLTTPVINTPADIQYSEDNTANVIGWIATDNYAGTYIIYLNSTQIGNGSWTSSVSIDYGIDGLDMEVYNFTIIVFDLSNNYVVDTVFVDVVDDTTPIFTITSPDQQYVAGEVGNVLIWNTTDKYPSTYIIYLDGNQVDSGSWTNGTDISLNIDGLVRGIYNYTIVVLDSSSNQAIDTTIINVIELTPPQIIYTSGDQTIVEGSLGNTINWTALEEFANLYNIYFEGSMVSSAQWTNNTLETISIDGLDMGVYNYTILIEDESNNSAKFTVFITVIDTTFPIITNSNESLNMIVGTSNNLVSWVVSDKNEGSYEIYKDGVIIDTSVWTDLQDISINVDDLSIGQYNFTLVVYDSSLNSVQSVTIVSVTYLKTNLPEIGFIPTVYEGYTDIITGTWTDENSDLIPTGIIKVYLNSTQLDDSVIIDGIFFVSIDYSSLVAGKYLISLTFEQLSYQNQTVILEVTVLPHKLGIDISFDDQLVPGEEFGITFRVIYVDSEITSNLGLNSFGTRSGGFEGAMLTTDIMLEYESGTIEKITLNGVSDGNGYVYFTLDSQQTTNLRSIQSIDARINSGLNTEGLEVNLGFDDIPQISTTISQDESLSKPQDDPLFGQIVLIGIFGVLGLLVIFLFLSRKTKEKYDKIQSTKKGILVRLSEMYSIRFILIIDQKTGNSLMEYVFKNDRVIENAVDQLISAYRIKNSVSKAGSYSSGSVKKMIDDIQKYDFVNLYYSKGSKLDIFIFTSGKITQTDKAIEYFDIWLDTKYNLEKKGDLKKLFEEKKVEILHGMHIQFDTWTMFKLKTSSKLDIGKVSDETQKNISNLIVEKENISFTEIVGKLNEKHDVSQIYNNVRELLTQLKLEVTV